MDGRQVHYHLVTRAHAGRDGARQDMGPPIVRFIRVPIAVEAGLIDLVKGKDTSPHRQHMQ